MSTSPLATSRVVILDRDGVINHDSDDFIKSPAEWEPLPGSLEAIARLTQAGVRVAVATNQSGIARGLYDLDTLHRIHEKMLRLLGQAGGNIEVIAYCPHGPEDECSCRKPRPGLLLEIARRMRIDLTGVPVIGDSLRDLQAAQAVDGSPILVKTGKGERTLASGACLDGIPVFANLGVIVDRLLTQID